jgi:hypothetical protein
VKSIEIHLASKDMRETMIILENILPINIDIEMMMTIMKEITTQESIISQEIETTMIIMKEVGMKGVIINLEVAMTAIEVVVDTVVAMTVIEVVDTVAMIVIEEVDTMMMIDMDILVVIMYSEELMMLSDRSMNILEEIMEEMTKIIMHHLLNQLNQHNQVQNLVKFNL